MRTVGKFDIWKLNMQKYSKRQNNQSKNPTGLMNIVKET